MDGRKPMASNFQILPYKTRDSLHLKLAGDFDGSSAHELINTLVDNDAGYYQIFINTNDLKTIHPFGREVLEKKLGSINKPFKNLIFIGENSHELSMN
jgi:hypothetical protein